MPMQTLQGSCHCGAVRFEADVDFAAGTTKCDCTFCWKQRWWSVAVAPDHFRPQAGEAALSDYRPGQADGHGGFCRHCGVSVYQFVPATDWNPAPKYSVSVAVFDNLDPADLLAAPVTLCDGRNDNWWHPPAETRHL